MRERTPEAGCCARPGPRAGVCYPSPMSADTPSAAVHEVVARPATRETFAPFGELLSTEGLEPYQRGSSFYATESRLYRPGALVSTRPVEYLIYEAAPRPLQIVFLERHVELTQSFVSLGAQPYVVAVARPGADEDEHGFPALHEIHAFVVPGDAGANLHLGTWHEPPFPLVAGSRFLITSHADLTRGLGSALDERGEVAKLDVEKRNAGGRSGLELRIRLP